MLAGMTSPYADLSKEDLIRTLERRDARRALGLVWERERITQEVAHNSDFVALDLDPSLSTSPGPDGGWRNLIIEGDNWDALRSLRLTHAGRVKCILIDPPYNTGNRDFTYNDRFVGKEDRYRQSLWLEFLYRRLLLARELLTEDGVILVCINDENRAKLDLLMEQVFPGMRLGSFVWRTKDTNNSDKRRSWSGVHEHILIFAKPGFGFIGPDVGPGKFKVRPEFGDDPVRLDPITKAGTFITRRNTYYPIQDPTTGLWYPCAPDRVWCFWSEAEVERQRNGTMELFAGPGAPRRRARARPGDGPSIESFIRAGDIHFPAEGGKEPFFFATRAELDEAIAAGKVPRDGKGRPLLRADLPDLDFWVGKPIAHGRLSRIVRKKPEDDNATKPVGSWIGGLGEESSDDGQIMLRSDRQGVASTEIQQLFGQQVFTFPKPLSLIRSLVQVTTQEGDIILDFFAGSGTTGHATLALNAEDDADGRFRSERRFILVSNTEATAEEPTKNLCRDVCAERLRRVIQGYGDSEPLPGDFAYLRTHRFAWDDVPYDLLPEQVWILLQLRHQRPLRPFNSALAVQTSPPVADEPDGATLAYAPSWSEVAEATLRELLAAGPVLAFSSAPGALREALNLSNVSIEATPGRLLDEFPQVIAGL